MGAAVTAVITPMINGVGSGWAFVILGFLNALGAPLMLLIMRNGIQWRRQLQEKQDRKKAHAQERKREKLERQEHRSK